MRIRKAPAFVLALILLLLCAPLALAQPQLPDFSGDTGGVMGMSFAVFFGCVCVFALIILAINIAILVWVYKDAQARGADPMMWLILVFFTGVIGLIIWLVVRPPLGGGPMGGGQGY